jgi:hypothetical protein
MHRPETKVERKVKIFPTNQVHENQCIGLNGEFPSFIPLGATAQGELWPPEQSASIFLYIHLRLIIWFLNNLVFMV